MKGDQINLFKFPVPKVFPMDGGRFFGTTAYTVSKDPETGWLNIGVYRLQVLDEKTLGTQFIKGKHADLMLQKYRALKKPMPVIVGIGGDPLFFLMGAARLPAFESEYDFAGAIRGESRLRSSREKRSTFPFRRVQKSSLKERSIPMRRSPKALSENTQAIIRASGRHPETLSRSTASPIGTTPSSGLPPWEGR